MRRQLYLIINLSVVSALVILGFSVIAPVLPQYALSFSVSVSMTGWAISAFALARLVMDMPSGIVADYFGRKRNMLVGLVLVVGSAAVSGLAPTYTWLIVGRVVQGLGSALYITAATAWVAEASTGEYRGRYMSVYSSFVFAGTSFGPAIGGYTAAHFGMSSPFFVYGAFAALGLLATLHLKETSRPAASGRAISLADVRTVLSSSSFLLVSFAVLALFFLRAGVRATLVPLYASLNVGLGEGDIGVLLTVAAVFTAILTLPSGWISDRIGRKIPIIACLLFSGLAIVLIPLQTDMHGLFVVMIVYGLATGLQGSLAAWPADVSPPDRLGTSMGLYRLIGDVGFVLGPITVTYAAGSTGNEAIPVLPFIIPAVLVVAASIGLLWASDPARRKRRGAVRQEVAGDPHGRE